MATFTGSAYEDFDNYAGATLGALEGSGGVFSMSNMVENAIEVSYTFFKSVAVAGGGTTKIFYLLDANATSYTMFMTDRNIVYKARTYSTADVTDFGTYKTGGNLCTTEAEAVGKAYNTKVTIA